MVITLKSQTSLGEPLSATYLPEKGMNLVSLKKGDLEVIDQSTKNLFEERFAGLGALIGPHFHHRHPQTIPEIKDESLFPHISRVKAKGIFEPFSHGIGRYAPWKAEATEQTIRAVLSGKDLWNEVPLSSFEGQNFKMEYQAELSSKGLNIEIDVVSDSDSLMGLHYYFYLPKKAGRVVSNVQKQYLDQGEKKTIPSTWNFNHQQVLDFDLKNAADYTFHPFPNPTEGKILLDAIDYQLQITYQCQSEENSWQLYHPEGASFVCIEPISAQDPHHPNLTASSLSIQIQFFETGSV